MYIKIFLSLYFYIHLYALFIKNKVIWLNNKNINYIKIMSYAQKLKKEIILKSVQCQKNKYTQMLLTYITQEKIDILLTTIDELYKSKKNNKYTNEYYLYYIFVILVDAQRWSALSSMFKERSCIPSKYHYKTIEDKHLFWSKLNVYEIAYKKILHSYNSRLKGSKTLNIFIDSTDVYNKNGVEDVGYGNNPKKKQTKVSAICDENKNILSLIIIATITKKQVDLKLPIKQTKKEKQNIKMSIMLKKEHDETYKIIQKELKSINKNSLSEQEKEIIKKINITLTKINNSISIKIDNGSKKKKDKLKRINIMTAKKTLQHDSQTIKDSLNSILIDINKCKLNKLGGDMGYIINPEDKKILKDTYNVELIHPNRKNQKEKTSYKNKKFLKNRYVIENVFAKLKVFDRICVRKDKLNVTFKGFLFLAVIKTSHIN